MRYILLTAVLSGSISALTLAAWALGDDASLYVPKCGAVGTNPHPDPDNRTCDVVFLRGHLIADSVVEDKDGNGVGELRTGSIIWFFDTTVKYGAVDQQSPFEVAQKYAICQRKNNHLSVVYIDKNKIYTDNVRWYAIWPDGTIISEQEKPCDSIKPGSLMTPFDRRSVADPLGYLSKYYALDANLDIEIK